MERRDDVRHHTRMEPVLNGLRIRQRDGQSDEPEHDGSGPDGDVDCELYIRRQDADVGERHHAFEADAEGDCHRRRGGNRQRRGRNLRLHGDLERR